MFASDLKIAFRNLTKHRTYTTINLAGLATGMAAALLILVFVVHESTYDRFHKHHQRIFMVYSSMKHKGMTIQTYNFPLTLGPNILSSDPHVKNYVRVLPANEALLVKNPLNPGVSFFEKNYLFADSSFYKVFSFKIRRQITDEPLNGPNTMVITEETGRRYFGDADPLGRTLLLGGKHPVQVTGIIDPAPSNSVFNYAFILSIPAFPLLSETNKLFWSPTFSFPTYLLLDSEKSAAGVENNLKKIAIAEGADGFGEQAYRLLPVADLHLNEDAGPAGNSHLINLFAGIAFTILALAFFNYINLTTARAGLRAREVGVRKAFGAGRAQLLKQFYLESALLCSAAFVLALFLVKLAQEPFYRLLDLRIDDYFLFNPGFLGMMALLLGGSILLAGSYPALALSGFTVADVLRNRFNKLPGGLTVRQCGIVVQFTAAVLLILGSLVIRSQLRYMQNRKLGFNKDQVLTLSLGKNINDHFSSFRQELQNLAGISGVSYSVYELFNGYSLVFSKNPEDGKEFSLSTISVDSQFVKMLGIEWAVPPIEPLPSTGKSILLNEAAVQKLNLSQNPIGLQLHGLGKVYGIVRDFHFSSLRYGIQPLAISMAADIDQYVLGLPSGTLYIRLDPSADIVGKVAAIEKIFRKYESSKPFEYRFLDDVFQHTFRTEASMARMFTVFTGLAIFIAAMGLFGLITFSAETRTREIGIRKVLGASVFSVVMLLSRDFFKLVCVAFLLALPLAWYFANRWLQDFTYRTEVPALPAIGISLLIVLATLALVGTLSSRAARVNPARTLRNE